MAVPCLVLLVVLALSPCCLLQSALAQGQQQGRLVHQASGAIFEGTVIPAERDRRAFYAFRGIPYAHPPINEKRWQDPELKPVSGTIDATQWRDKCPHFEATINQTIGREDCLYLNVFTPSLPSQGPGVPSRPGAPIANRLLPVMVYIHGGGFEKGSSDTYGPRRLMRQDVILVTVNYRLGILGFLSTGDEVMPGNYGLLDVIAALRWVKLHIRGFGGNPDSVTIFGHSAGAAMVHMLMLSPRASTLGLFHKAIIQSGSAVCPWAIEDHPMEYTEGVAAHFECSTGSSEEIRDCLAEKSPLELIEFQNMNRRNNHFPLRAVPVVDAVSRPDNPVLPDHPKTLMNAGAYIQIPVMAGVTSDEGLGLYTFVHLEHGQNIRDKDYFRENVLKTLVPDITKIPESDELTKAVEEHYGFDLMEMNTTAGGRHATSELIELIGDSLNIACNYEMLEKFSNNPSIPVYSYVFTHRSSHSPSSVARNIVKLKTGGVYHPMLDDGVSHGDELYYLFDPVRVPSGSVNKPLGAVDDRVADTMTRIWAGFAADGNPTEAAQSMRLVPWRPIRQGNVNYYNLSSVSTPMGSDYRKGESMFWLRTAPYIQELGSQIDYLSVFPILFYIFLALFIIFLIITIILAVVLHKKRTSGQANL